MCKLNSLWVPKPRITPNQANRSLWGWKIEFFPRKRAAAPPGATFAVGGWTSQEKNIYPNLLRMINWQEFPFGNTEQIHTGRSWELLSPGEHRSSWTSFWKVVENCLEDSLWECHRVPRVLQHLKPPKVTKIGSSAQMEGTYNGTTRKTRLLTQIQPTSPQLKKQPENTTPSSSGFPSSPMPSSNCLSRRTKWKTRRYLRKGFVNKTPKHTGCLHSQFSDRLGLWNCFV